ncbi:MAG: tryptophan synthase subunit alpha [Candidatus Firestonebacteria bacterium]|nr:tryptophan synthase subunit alpha [Candidatus Firestonebacteria bacterium]
MITELDSKLKNIKKSGKKFFAPFITAGYPNLSVTEKLILEMEACGADLIELGIPFSDPLADGPIIQHASEVSLQKGTNLTSIFSLVKKVRYFTKIPIVFMSYYNLIYHYGIDQFVQSAKENGVNGLIVPDLPPEEALYLIKTAKENNLSTIFLFTPTSSKERIKLITQKSTGFIYYVSLTGVTGTRDSLSSKIKSDIEIARQFTDKPIGVGFGVSNTDQAREAAISSDGVIVGSAIIKEISNNINESEENMVNKVSIFIKQLSKAIHEE